jgi:protein-ribulosamine 3-kinase
VLEADALQNALDVALNDRVVIEDTETVAGGDIHRALRVRANGRDWFIKWNSADALAQFSAEAEALEVLARSAGPRVPHPLATGSDERHAWLVLEFLPLYGQGDASALGASLAMMHRETAALHGWSADNFIGTTPQRNGSLENWSDFWWRAASPAASRNFATD